MLEKTKTIIAPVAAAAAMVGTNPNALAADAEANQTQKTVGALAANQAAPKDPSGYIPDPADSSGVVPDETSGGPINSDIENGLVEVNNQVMDMKLGAIEEVAFQQLAAQHDTSEAPGTDSNNGPSSVPEEEMRPNIVETPPAEQQPSDDSKEAIPPKDPYQLPQTQNPIGELAPNETGPLNNGLRDGVAVMEQRFSEMTNDPYQPPQTAEAPATKTPATGQNNGSASGAPAEVPAP